MQAEGPGAFGELEVAAELAGVPSPEQAYVFAAWSSWLIPLGACVIVEHWPAHRPVQRTCRTQA